MKQNINNCEFAWVKRKGMPLLTISVGQRLRLRDDVARDIQAREWIFKRVEKDGTILLVHESAGFGWNVKPDHIDWKAYRKRKAIEDRI